MNTPEFSPLLSEIRKLIKSSGPMPVWRYMQLCLMHPQHGYYVSRDPLGREGDFTIVETHPILSPEAYETLQGVIADARLPMAFNWRFQVDVSRIDATRAGELETTLRRFENLRPRSGVSDVPTNTTLHAGLLRLLLLHEARWTSAAALLGVVGMGAIFVAASCLALVALLASNGRRRTSALALARGARLRTVRISLIAEGLVLSVPAAALALALAWLIEPA